MPDHLTAEQISVWRKKIADLLSVSAPSKKDLDDAEGRLQYLGAHTSEDLTPFLERMNSFDDYYPGVQYRKASPVIRDQLIERLKTVDTSPNTLSLNGLLTALAWVGDETVIKLFSEWRKNPPAWKSSLYIPPHEYSRQAGWELMASGERRPLFYDTCYGMIPVGCKTRSIRLASNAVKPCDFWRSCRTKTSNRAKEFITPLSAAPVAQPPRRINKPRFPRR